MVGHSGSAAYNELVVEPSEQREPFNSGKRLIERGSLDDANAFERPI